MQRRLEPSGPCTSALAAAACIGHRASCMGARVRCVEGVVRSLLRMPRGMDVACATDAWHAACCVLCATCRVVRLLRVASTCHVVGCCTLQALCRVAHALRSKQTDHSPSQSTASVLLCARSMQHAPHNVVRRRSRAWAGVGTRRTESTVEACVTHTRGGPRLSTNLSRATVRGPTRPRPYSTRPLRFACLCGTGTHHRAHARHDARAPAGRSHAAC